MLFTKLRISADSASRLRSLRQRTGLTPNLLCRLGLTLSLEEGPLGSGPPPDEQGLEFNAYTLMGDHEGLINALVRLVEEKDGQELDDEALLERLRGHLHRGVAQLSVRARSPLEIAQLVAHASAA